MIQSEHSEFEGRKTFSINNKIKNYWNSDYRKHLTKNFLQNKRLPECKKCWDQENSKLISHRQLGNRSQKVLFNKNFEQHLLKLNKLDIERPEEINLSITNLCNLKCQMCEGASSSTLLNENIKLGFEKDIQQKDYDWAKSSKIQFINDLLKHDLRTLNLMGGESLMVPEILKILKELSARKDVTDNLELTVITNGTTLNNKIFDILNKFKKLKLMISMESTGKQNEYMRFPSKWEIVEQNILKYKTLDNASLYINCVVQNLNILYIDQLIEFAVKHHIHLNFTILDGPTYLKFDNLPYTIIKRSLDKLKKIPPQKFTHVTNIENLLLLMQKRINERHVPPAHEYKKFTTMIQARDNHRKISIKNYMPELAEEILL